MDKQGNHEQACPMLATDMKDFIERWAKKENIEIVDATPKKKI
jgi:hypothetical protein